MNIIEIILMVVIAAAVIAALVVMFRKKKNSRGCSCGCEGCAMACHNRKP